ncbi:bifunctional helix-turn-helix domain-containing protein/methylated-DNA--[protein]-cysteine S-methyltransferase [Thioclava kandeliae]|uniref:Bifunctional helix-turn-helix domain-containing protein/methylated-DNA--[protein]-cysteine S-methyltransferase n=1 Tax=Thioclava kandeliae TaxID=3070818 RepID=A0ABV1SEK3_9RHOB
MEDRYHYRLIARAIAEIDAAHAEGLTPSLADLAQRLNLSEAHFQKCFTAWAGVSPKRYMQYLKLDLAKDLLRKRHPLIAVAADTGLSGSARLHDLILRWEAMTPGEFARAGAGLTIHWGRFETHYGPVIAMGTGRGICGMAFTEVMGEALAFADLAKRWPAAQFREDPAALGNWVAAAFAQRGDVSLTLTGGAFQIKVWEALLQIPEGAVSTYQDIATAIGSPKATRAVGTAIGKNPIAALIPCHRALRKSGGLGGYHWGLTTKRVLLAREAARSEAERSPML